MAIFGLKKKQEVNTEEKVQSKETRPKATKKAEKVVASKVDSTVVDTSVSVGSIIYRPRVTEKSGIKSQDGVYTFEVSRHANKNQVANAVKSLYKVNPIKVAMINVKPKSVFVRGKKGVVSGFKKAFVTLKKGEKIDFV